MRHAPPAAGTERTVVVATVGHLQRARGDGIAVRIERRVAQQRDDTLLLGVTDAVLHSVRALVPLRRCVARMLGQILLVDAVRTNDSERMLTASVGQL